MVSSSVKLDTTLGAGYIGTLVVCIFYGVICIQVYMYFQTQSRDSRMFKAVIALLWVLNSAHVVVIAITFYFYLITDSGNYSFLASKPFWGIHTQVYISAISDLIMKTIFGKRAWILASRNHFLAAGIGTASLATFVSAYVFCVKTQNPKTPAESQDLAYVLYMGFATCNITDIIIAVSLCFSLYKRQTGFRKSNSLVNGLIVYTINTTLLTTLCSIACSVTFAIWPNDYIYVAIYFSMSKLYLSNLLVMLNSRELLAEKMTGIENISMPTFRSRHLSLIGAGDMIKVTPPVMSINMEQFEKIDTARQLA